MAAINQIDFTIGSSSNPYQLISSSRLRTTFPSEETQTVSETENQNGKEYTGSSNKKLGFDELPRDLENNRKFPTSNLTSLYEEIFQTVDSSIQKEETFDVQNVFTDKPSTSQQTTSSFRDYKRKKILRQVAKDFSNFQNFLGTPEAAMHIHLAKKKLEEIWDFIAYEDREIGMMISAIEDSIRQLKWRDYKPYQVEIIRNIIQDCVDGRVRNQKDIISRTSKLFKHNIDIFPSATEEAYDENE